MNDSSPATTAALRSVPGSTAAVQPPLSPQGSAPPPPAPPPPAAPPPNMLRRVIVRALIVGLAVLAGGLFMVDWDDLLLLNPVQRTDDAYLQGDPTTLSAHVPGYVHRVAVADMETVKEGQVLYEIDDAEYRAQVDLARAQVAEAGAQVAIAAAQIGLQERQIDVTQSNADLAQSDLIQAEQERSRQNASARHARFSAAHLGAGDPERPRAAGHGGGQPRHHRVADGAAQSLARDARTDGSGFAGETGRAAERADQPRLHARAGAARRAARFPHRAGRPVCRCRRAADPAGAAQRHLGGRELSRNAGAEHACWSASAADASTPIPGSRWPATSTASSRAARRWCRCCRPIARSATSPRLPSGCRSRSASTPARRTRTI